MKNKNILWVFFVLLSSCAFWQNLREGFEESVPHSFTHPAHLTGAEPMECIDCHEYDAKQDRYTMPPLTSCFVCHVLEIEKEKNPKTYAMLVALQAKQSEYPWTSHALDEERIFTHTNHGGTPQRKITCEQCHPVMKEKNHITAAIHPDKDACNACHEAYGAPLTCETCHKEINFDRRPPSHQGDWKHLHGDEIALTNQKTLGLCWRCHGKDGCNRCHEAEKPRDHNAFWRREGHGIEALMDRSRCMLCHQNDLCIRCHQDTKPRSHRGNWGSPGNQHCLHCHMPLGSSNCFFCHKALPPFHPGTRK